LLHHVYNCCIFSQVAWRASCVSVACYYVGLRARLIRGVRFRHARRKRPRYRRARRASCYSERALGVPGGGGFDEHVVATNLQGGRLFMLFSDLSFLHFPRVLIFHA
jgi:hypothetical protein